MFSREGNLKSVTLYAEDLLELEEIIKKYIESNERYLNPLTITIRMEDQRLEFESMEAAIRKMNEINVLSNNRIQISIFSRVDSNNTQYLSMRYFKNGGILSIEGENELWVKGLFEILNDKLKQIRDKNIINKYHYTFTFTASILAGILLGPFGFMNLSSYFESQNFLHLILGVFFILIGVIILYNVNIKGSMFPFFRTYFFSREEKKALSSEIKITMLFSIISIIIASLQLYFQIS